MDCRMVTACRVCQSPLAGVLDLGTQCLGGQFPARGEPDPPAFLLCLYRCTGCGLVQLGHTVDPELMFRKYGYRSGVTQTMRDHLWGIAEEAVFVLGREPKRVLDIGGNDGTLLGALPLSVYKASIDPADIEEENPGITRIKGFFPRDLMNVGDFDLIFSIACFYDADDPVAFAKAVAANLAPDGLWCVEVADFPEAMRQGTYDGICHEHLLYFDFNSLRCVLNRAGFEVHKWAFNGCNGGSVRVYARKGGEPPLARYPEVTAEQLNAFAERVQRSAGWLMDYLLARRDAGQTVHLLGASTKANTWLQYAGVTAELVRAASDRDPRKRGKQTPGTHIPILSEEASRLLKPDVYLVGPHHFRAEIVAREQGFLFRGGKLVFPMTGEEVGG